MGQSSDWIPQNFLQNNKLVIIGIHYYNYSHCKKYLLKTIINLSVTTEEFYFFPDFRFIQFGWSIVSRLIFSLFLFFSVFLFLYQWCLSSSNFKKTELLHQKHNLFYKICFLHFCQSAFWKKCEIHCHMLHLLIPLILSCLLCLKVHSQVSGLMKKWFYFTIKAFLVLKIFTFLPWLFGHE